MLAITYQTDCTLVCLFSLEDALYIPLPSQLTFLLSIKATNALLIRVILELPCQLSSPFPPPFPCFGVSQQTDDETMAIHLHHAVRITINVQLFSLHNAARLAHECIQRKSTISWELGMSFVVNIIKMSRKSRVDGDWAGPQILHVCLIKNYLLYHVTKKKI